MKKKWTLALLSLLLLFSLPGCTKEDSAPANDVVVVDGQEFIVDRAQGIIDSQGYRYLYTAQDGGVEIIYPNGATYWWAESNGSGYGGWSDDYDEEVYVPGPVLTDIIFSNVSTASPGETKNYLLVLLLIPLGLWNILSPRSSWYLSYGWRYKNAEPSDDALIWIRVAGVGALVIAVFYLFI